MTDRAEFSPDVRRKLAERAGFRCSFPGCGRPTIGPSNEGPLQTSNTGEAAHIIAASTGPGARRSRPEVPDEERRDIGNGIWMCRTHAKQVDTDEVRFTIEMLRDWRLIAEERAKIIQDTPSADVLRLFSSKCLTEHSIDLAGVDGSEISIGQALDDCCVRILWGDELFRAARDCLIEVCRNAFQHGGATTARLEITAHSLQLHYDGAPYDPRTLLLHPKRRGGADAVEFLAAGSKPILVRWTYEDARNVFTLVAPRTEADVIDGFRPCAIQVVRGREETQKSVKFNAECDTVYVVLPAFASISDAYEIAYALMDEMRKKEREVYVFCNDHSKGVWRILNQFVPRARFVELYEHGT